MVDFKKMLSQCRKQLTFPENSIIELPKFCKLLKEHDGQCSDKEPMTQESKSEGKN